MKKTTLSALFYVLWIFSTGAQTTAVKVNANGTVLSTNMPASGVVNFATGKLTVNGVPLSGGGSGSGSVTSVAITGSNGLTISGSPITTAGTINLTLDSDLQALATLGGTNTIYYRSAPSTWTAVTIGSGISFSSGTLSATVDIDDTAYDATSWNNVTTVAPSKNAVRDKFETLRIGTDVQAFASNLTTWAGIGPALGMSTWLVTPSSANLRAVVSDETGTGLLYFQGGDIGTPSAGVVTNLTGTASGLTAGNVTTNANLTGNVTSLGNATTVAVIPSGVTVSGSELVTAIVAPGTPVAGKASFYVDSTSKNLAVKDDAGVVKHGVQTKSAAVNQFLTGINDSGVVSSSFPAFTDLTGAATVGQLPVDTDGGLVANSDALIPSQKAVKTAVDLKATIASPTFTGTVTVPSGAVLGTPNSITLTNATFPTLNQSTTGSAGSLKSTGSTGLITITGPGAAASRAKTVRDADDTILELGGSYTPTGTWTNLTLVTPALGTPTALVATNATGTAASLTAGSATILANVRTINGVSFNGSANIVVPAYFGRQILTSSSGTYTPTAGTVQVVIKMLGAGGGGGGTLASASNISVGGGGGAGGYLEKWVSSVSGTYSYTVGAGGAGATGSGTGTAGGNSTFVNGGTTYTSFGGSGGTSLASGTAVGMTAGGAGGVISTNGDINAGGINGGMALRTSGTVGTSGFGGGASPYGSGGAVNISTSADGAAGLGYGAGGSGAMSNSTTARNGGTGVGGIIIVEEYR